MQEVLFNNELEISAAELRALNLTHHNNLKNFFRVILQSPGIAVVTDQSGNLLDAGLVTETETNQVGIRAFFAITPNYGFISFPGESDITIPATGSVYNILVRHAVTNFEDGTATILSGTTNVTGTNTHFTRFKGERTQGSVLYPGHGIEIDGVDFTIDAITSDTGLTVKETAAANLVDRPFKIKGSYFTAQPDEYLFGYDAYTVVVTLSAPTADDILLATVSNNGGVLTIIDKRVDNLLKLISESVFIPEEPNSPVNLALSWIVENQYADNYTTDRTLFRSRENEVLEASRKAQAAQLQLNEKYSTKLKLVLGDGLSTTSPVIRAIDAEISQLTERITQYHRRAKYVIDGEEGDDGRSLQKILERLQTAQQEKDKVTIVFNWEEPAILNNEPIVQYNYRFGIVDENNAVVAHSVMARATNRAVRRKSVAAGTTISDTSTVLKKAEFSGYRETQYFFGVQAVTEAGLGSDWRVFKKGTGGGVEIASGDPTAWIAQECTFSVSRPTGIDPISVTQFEKLKTSTIQAGVETLVSSLQAELELVKGLTAPITLPENSNFEVDEAAGDLIIDELPFQTGGSLSRATLRFTAWAQDAAGASTDVTQILVKIYPDGQPTNFVSFSVDVATIPFSKDVTLTEPATLSGAGKLIVAVEKLDGSQTIYLKGTFKYFFEPIRSDRIYALSAE